MFSNSHKIGAAAARMIFVAAVGASLSACSHAVPVNPVPTAALVPTVPHEQDQHARGSLFSQQQSCLTCDRKAAGVGDVLVVVIDENARASKKATTDTKRGSSMSAGMPNLLGLEGTGLRNWLDMSHLVNASFDGSNSGSGSTTRTENLVATMAVRVVEVPSADLYAIRGTRSVVVNGEEQLMTLTGLVRRQDIGANNTVNSSTIAEAHISYTGKGVISDQQKPGWLARALSVVWPF